MVPALAVTEALIASVTQRFSGGLDERLEEIEQLRAGYRAAFSGPGLNGSGTAEARADAAWPPEKTPHRRATRAKKPGL